MMTNKSWEELMKDERWQAKRLEIIKRDGFKCRKCRRKNSDKGFSVHHIAYLGERKPWSYPDQLLITLCHRCHMKLHRERNIKTALKRWKEKQKFRESV